MTSRIKFCYLVKAYENLNTLVTKYYTPEFSYVIYGRPLPSLIKETCSYLFLGFQFGVGRMW